MADSRDFPFTIMDVAALLRLNVRRRGSGHVYVDCPICGDRRGKMNLNLTKNVWRCNYCGESGGMLALYAKVYGTSNTDAYWEICDALAVGDRAPEYTAEPLPVAEEIPQSRRASVQQVHQTLSMLLSMLTLTQEHREHLRVKRGLTDDQIEAFGFKSTPPPFLCQSLTQRLIRSGCTVQGVPGFYVNDAGKWTVKFYQRTNGIIIPIVGLDGLIHGAQIRLDRPLKDENDPPEKEGAKYLTFASTGKRMGTSSGSPIHFVGDPCARVVYVTEGPLKADIAHAYMNRTFAAIIGANNTAQLEDVFRFLARNGTELIVEAVDMDKYRNVMVEKGTSKIYLMARKYGLACQRLTWNPNYKGIDDWQLALHRKMIEKKEESTMNTEEHSPEDTAHYQRFRVYQLDLSNGATQPFAFAGIAALYQAGYRQPPAAEYCLTYDGKISRFDGQSDSEVLERVFKRYNDDLPQDYKGRSIAASDVVELYGDEGRRYFYRDLSSFIPVKFSPMLVKKSH